MKKIIYCEKRVRRTWLSGSKSRCSISSRKVVLLNDGKKRSRKRLGAIFRKIGKVVLGIIEVILALGTLADFALFIWNRYGW